MSEHKKPLNFYGVVAEKRTYHSTEERNFISNEQHMSSFVLKGLTQEV
jgi:hypothetical protein